MSLRPYKNRRDISEKSIVDALRKAGAAVYLMDRPVDALMHHRGRTSLLEFKTGKGKLTPAQEKFRAEWPGPVFILRTPQDAIDFLNGDA